MASKLSPVFQETQFDNNGDPLAGGLILWELAGTSTATSVWTTSAGTVAHANPIVLNARGEPPSPIWLTTGASYKATLKTAAGVVIRYFDTITGIGDSTIAVSEWAALGITPTYIGATSFSVPGDQTLTLEVHRRLQTVNTAGTIYSTIRSATYSAPDTTVVVFNDSGVLDAGLSSVFYGILNATNPSSPGRVIITSQAAGQRRENLLLNGEFIRWSYAATQTATGYGSVDRWPTYRTGSTMAISRGTHTVGQTAVPGHPRYYFINAVTSAANAANNINMQQRVDDIARFSGETVTFSIYAKATAGGKLLGINMASVYGSGGSATDEAAGVNFALTTDWARYTYTYTVPSVTGLTIGADNFLGVRLWLDAGANYNTQTDSMGQQSGTFHFSDAQLEFGTVATDFMRRTEQETVMLCLQYYTTLLASFRGNSTTNAYCTRALPVLMRTTPVITLDTVPTYSNSSGLTTDSETRTSFREIVTVTAPGVFHYASGIWAVTAEL